MFAAGDPLQVIVHVPPVYGISLELPKCQVSPPRNKKPIPGAGVTAAHWLAQLGIPGARSQGLSSVLPLFVSAPDAAMK